MTAFFKFCVVTLVALVAALGLYGLTAPSHDPPRQFVSTNTGVHATVLWVLPESNAAKAGLRPGDVIDNDAVPTAAYFARNLARTGQHVTLNVLRNGTERATVRTFVGLYCPERDSTS